MSCSITTTIASAQLAACLEEQGSEGLGLPLGHTGGGLVEAQDAGRRAAGQAGELDDAAGVPVDRSAM
ncbi:MAG: hypothetical protein V9F03_10530 [Microthrixaceae bacterium]